ncbi:hypothetical protein D3C85_1043700 [compost metagenome]
MPAIAEDRLPIAARARELAVDVLYSEKGQFADARGWRHLSRWFGLPGAILAALAGAQILAEFGGVILPALTAFASAAVTAAIGFLKPEECATRHHNAGTAYGGLRRRLRHFVQIDCFLADVRTADLAAKLDALVAEVNELQRVAPPISSGGFKAAKQAIEGGTADYTENELVTAAGPIPTEARP